MDDVSSFIPSVSSLIQRWLYDYNKTSSVIINLTFHLTYPISSSAICLFRKTDISELVISRHPQKLFKDYFWIKFYSVIIREYKGNDVSPFIPLVSSVLQRWLYDNNETSSLIINLTFHLSYSISSSDTCLFCKPISQNSSIASSLGYVPSVVIH